MLEEKEQWKLKTKVISAERNQCARSNVMKDYTKKGRTASLLCGGENTWEYVMIRDAKGVEEQCEKN